MDSRAPFGGAGPVTGRVLLVEDDPALAGLLKWTLEREAFHVTHTANGMAALALAAAEPLPDIVLLDWMIEGLAGIEVCRRLRRRPETARLPILFLTGRICEEDRVRALDGGADDYVTKPFTPRELVARIRALLRRAGPAAAAGGALRFADLEMDLTAHKVRRAGRAVALGPVEFRLLRHFLKHPTRVFSRERLLAAVWGGERDIALRTVDVHIRRLRIAIHVDGRPGLVRTVRSAGYSLDDDA
ncbi:MAG TPA: response regulator [Allosphingosinicella sp.]|nr:response regulator [Allosphingosinicella sp.]